MWIDNLFGPGPPGQGDQKEGPSSTLNRKKKEPHRHLSLGPLTLVMNDSRQPFKVRSTLN